MKLQPPALLLAVAACASSGCAGQATTTQSAPTVHLTVHLGLFGGPARPDGRMGLENGPDPGVPIMLTDATGRSRRTQTDDNSIARFAIRPGRYTIESPTCGHVPRHVVIRSDRHVRLRCDVP
jgi:hypothetical protein